MVSPAPSVRLCFRVFQLVIRVFGCSPGRFGWSAGVGTLPPLPERDVGERVIAVPGPPVDAVSTITSRREGARCGYRAVTQQMFQWMFRSSS